MTKAEKHAIQLLIGSYKYFRRYKKPRNNYIKRHTGNNECPLCIIAGKKIGRLPWTYNILDCREAKCINMVHHNGESFKCGMHYNLIPGKRPWTACKDDMALNRIKELERLLTQ